MKIIQLKPALVAAAASVALVSGAHAQTADALIDKLIDKGILTVDEAKELREESDKDFNRAYASKSGMPDWVTALKFNGDMRGRFEGFYGESDAFKQRNRFRYRLRFGVTANLFDDFEVGLRLTSSEANGTFGGDPISGNTSFADNGSKKFIYFDTAYAKWSPIHTAEWAGSFTIGKMDNPFVFPSTMMFDRDYTPEGAAAQFAYTFNDHHSLKIVGAGFMLDEIGGNGQDPYVVGGQVRWDGIWNPHWAATLGAAGFSIANEESLSNGNVPNVNRGNTRNGATAPAFDFNPIYVDGGVTWTLASFWRYAGPFPINISGDYVNNPAASSENEGYSAGITFGKAGKKGTWELAYRYARLEADAWFEEFTESDFGAFYGVALANSGLTAGYGAGTNVKGHWVRLSYSPYDSLTLSAACFFTELIVPTSPDSDMTRLQVDAMWRF